jgi:FkbH-like protein
VEVDSPGSIKYRRVKFAEALSLARQGPANGLPFTVNLACGFTPLHLATFLQAYLQQAVPFRRIEVRAGAYGDLAGTLENAANTGAQATAIAIEWPDLDPRLGYRQLGGWGPDQAVDAAKTVRFSLDRIERAIAALPAPHLVAVSLPTLPPAPIFSTAGWQASKLELALLHDVFEFAESIAGRANTLVVNPHRLADASSPHDRFDLRSELFCNLPWTVAHADSVAAALSRLIQPPAPKKGLITDLDDTLWFGILGDIGPDEIVWDLASHHSVHGIYQQLLRALADEGILLAIASKNDSAAVEKVFERKDLLLPSEKVFPMEIHWSAKSGSIDRILATWNISADAVVFVDDSPMELAEVKQAHPEMECLLFPKADHTAAFSLFQRIRDLFGRARISNEDRLRLDSVRQGAAFREAAVEGGAASDEFLRSMQAVVTMEFQTDASDERLLELLNKTNQFNLNGQRYTQADWNRQMAEPGAFLLAVSYSDKFGPLGKIGALQGNWLDGSLRVHCWVLSCRAFARRIEHQALKLLLDRFPAKEVCFDFAPTARNTPLQEFFAGLPIERRAGELTLSRAAFEEKCPPLYHAVDILKPEGVQG